MKIDMEEIQKLICHGISVGIPESEIFIETCEKFNIPFNNTFLTNSIRQIIVYHVTQKVNLELTRLQLKLQLKEESNLKRTPANKTEGNSSLTTI